MENLTKMDGRNFLYSLRRREKFREFLNHEVGKYQLDRPYDQKTMEFPYCLFDNESRCAIFANNLNKLIINGEHLTNRWYHRYPPLTSLAPHFACEQKDLFYYVKKLNDD